MSSSQFLESSAMETDMEQKRFDLWLYDEHVKIFFPEMKRYAHVYVVKDGDELQFRPLEKDMEIDKRPAVVFC